MDWSSIVPIVLSFTRSVEKFVDSDDSMESDRCTSGRCASWRLTELCLFGFLSGIGGGASQSSGVSGMGPRGISKGCVPRGSASSGVGPCGGGDALGGGECENSPLGTLVGRPGGAGAGLGSSAKPTGNDDSPPPSLVAT